MKNIYIQKSKILTLLFSIVFSVIIFLFTSDKMFAQNNKAQNMSVPAAVRSGSSNVLQTDEKKSRATIEQTEKSQNNNSNPSAQSVLAPPANDNCSTALSNSLAPGANCTSGTLSGATVEAGETFGCNGGPPTNSVWYSFIASVTDMYVDLKQTSTPLVCGQNFGIRVYTWTGACPPTNSSAVGCQTYSPYSANEIYTVLKLTGLVPGTTYIVQVVQNPGCTKYKFCIEVGETSSCNTCGNICGPMCVYAGPIPPTVPQVEATCPSYPLAPPMNQNDSLTQCYSFTAPNDTVNLQQVVFAYCSPGNTYSFTYDLYTPGCALIQSGNVFANNQITGLTPGTTYRICYSIVAACSWDSVIYPYAYSTSSVLPVEMISFGANPYKGKVKIYWTTASENNAKEFIIERTRNAKDFTEIAHVKAAGNSTSLLNYKGYDDAPLTGENYYRLKQVDFNGRFTYTRLVATKFSLAVADLRIMPNPAKDKAIIRFNAAGNYSARLKVNNMQGSTMLNKQFMAEEGLNEYSLNMNELPKGIYSVQLIIDDQDMISKLVKE